MTKMRKMTKMTKNDKKYFSKKIDSKLTYTSQIKKNDKMTK